MANAPTPGPEEPGRVFGALLRFFEDDEWPFIPSEDGLVLKLPFDGRNGRWVCFAQAREAHEQFVFYSVYPVLVPEGRRPAVAEYITRANYGMILGNFELDYTDGEVRYKTSLDVEGADLTPALIRQCVYANVLMMDQYLPGLIAILSQGMAPIDALAQVEGRPASP
jgi:hypothetical protein